MTPARTCPTCGAAVPPTPPEPAPDEAIVPAARLLVCSLCDRWTDTPLADGWQVQPPVCRECLGEEGTTIAFTGRLATR